MPKDKAKVWPVHGRRFFNNIEQRTEERHDLTLEYCILPLLLFLSSLCLRYGRTWTVQRPRSYQTLCSDTLLSLNHQLPFETILNGR